MKKLLLAIAALLLAAPAVHAQQIPSGPYQSQCTRIRVVGNDLTAACRVGNTHNFNNTVLFLPCNGMISANVAGNLTCNGVPGPAWSPTANYVAFTINGSGAVAANVGGACDRSCTLLLNASALTAITATPKDPGYAFESWDGDCRGATGSVCYLDTTLPHRVTANFSVTRPTLTIEPALHGTIVDAGTNGRVVRCGHGDRSSCVAQLAPGTPIMLNPVPDHGYYLYAWNGDCAFTRVVTCTLPMSANYRVSATFVAAGFKPVPAPVSPPVSPPGAAQ